MGPHKQCDSSHCHEVDVQLGWRVSMASHITRVTHPHHTLHQWVGARGHGEEGLADGRMESE